MYQYNVNEIISAFQQHMLNNGLRVPQGHPIGDGKIHRVPTLKDKNGRTSGSYQLHLDGKPNGWLINFQESSNLLKWIATKELSNNKFDEEEYKAVLAEIEAKKAQRQEARLKLQEETAKHLKQKYTNPEFYGIESVSNPFCINQIPYLNKKGIGNLLLKGVFFDTNNRLNIPLYNKNGELQSEQTIDANGNKLFAKNGKKIGTFHIIDLEIDYKQNSFAEVKQKLKQCETIAIGEGYATVACVFDCVRDKKTAFIAAMDANNLINVVQELHAQYPNKKYLIIADNDLSFKGQNTAQKAAQITSGAILFPQNNPQDFNDIYQKPNNRPIIKKHFKWCIQKIYEQTNKKQENNQIKRRLSR